MPARGHGFAPFSPVQKFPDSAFEQPTVSSGTAASGSTTYTDAPTGTLTLSGSLTESWTYSSSPAGTLTLSGSSSDHYGVVYTDAPTGTVTLTGSASTATTFQVAVTGTATLTGTSTDSYVVLGPTRTSSCDLTLEQGGLLELEDGSGFLALEVCVSTGGVSSAHGGRNLEDELYALLRNDDEVAALVAGVMA